MKDDGITTINPERRGFLTALPALAAVIGCGLWWRRTATPPAAVSGPRELSLQQIDYDRPHDLAG